MTIVSLDQLRAQALELLPAESGGALDQLARALVALGVAVSVTALDRAAIDKTIADAMDAGASLAQVQEVIALVSGLGVHSLMVSQVAVLDAARARGLVDERVEFDPERKALWDRHVGDDPFWGGFEKFNPGCLKAMLQLSPDIFSAFFDYCAVPWRSGAVRAKIKELIAMACDATPEHRFAPGFHLHLENALGLGASRAEVLAALDIAAAAPQHSGTA